MMNKNNTPLDLATVRERLANKKGRFYWRSLAEAAETEEFREFLDREFPRYASEMRDPASRRTFLKLMGASLALAGLSGCEYALRPYSDKIVPYVRLPEGLIPGKPLFFATTFPFNGYGMGLVAESHEGRPTKIEGNEDHPASLGATNVFAQASVLDMYDPDRSQKVRNKGADSSWDAFVAAIGPALQGAGGGLRILSETVTSPTLVSQIQALIAANAGSRWDQYQPINNDNAFAGAQQAFGSPLSTTYNFDQADVVLSLDADFLYGHPSSVRYARNFAAQRLVNEEKKTMSRFYMVEASTSVTGSNADHRLPVRPSQIENVARAIAGAVGVGGAAAAGELPEGAQAFIEAVAQDLQGARGRSIVIAGEAMPPAVHALAHAINGALGNAGQTVNYIAPVEAQPAQPTTQVAALQQLVQEMNGGQVQALVILGGNPAFTAPADLKFAEALGKVPLSVHLSAMLDETSQAATWHVPAKHYLECWGDALAFDGTPSVIQPLVAPLYPDTRSAYELVAALQGQQATDEQIVTTFWQGQNLGGAFEDTWREALQKGVLPAPAPAAATASLAANAVGAATEAAAGEFEVVFRPDPSLWDGGYANNGWLQELPRPGTKLVWDNPALLSPATAEKLGVTDGDMVTVTVNGRALDVPVWRAPGHADDTLTLTLGYGRKFGRVGTDVGFNTYTLRGSDAPWFAGATVQKTGAKHMLVSTQEFYLLKDTAQGLDRSNLIRAGTLQEFLEHPHFVEEQGHTPEESLYPPYDYSKGYSWGMSINLTTCIGCNVCTIACQAENNIPVVGKLEVSKGREMHWIRVDRYYSGADANPTVYHQPVPCMQCENAPCEIVCPVGATVHDGEGINVMVYNRCVGTKYCSNNCPYKVRRFNFLQYSDESTPVIQLQHNPNVSVRIKGVMEKCNYCLQRIASARQESERLDRTIADGEVRTACQQACPTGAITFGNLNDASSEVVKSKQSELNFGLLSDLNTRPRTTYLALLRNPNPTLKTE